MQVTCNELTILPLVVSLPITMICTLFDLFCSLIAISIITYGIYALLKLYRGRDLLQDVERRCIFITGCDSGFGRAAALSLDKLGCIVIAGCLTQKGAQDLEQKSSGRLRTVIVDISKTESIEKALEEVKTKLSYLGLWGLVNNAGVGSITGPVEFFTREDFEKIYQVNVFGTAEVTRLFLPLIRNSRGRVVNISSVSGLVAFTNGAPYSSSKFALECYSDCLRRDQEAFGIKVSVIEPGLYQTNLATTEAHGAQAWAKWASLPQSVKDIYGEKYMEKDISGYKKFTEKYASSDLTPVTDAITHALLAVHPRERYLLNVRSYIYKLLAVLPTCLSDLAMMKLLKQPTPKFLLCNHNDQ